MDDEKSGNKSIYEEVEILSPAGSMASVYAAVNAGCNAVYVGGKNFNARNGAENFDMEAIGGIISYCHLRGVKVYITVNTLYKDKEIQELLTFMADAYAYGADAFILQDMGVATAAKQYFPEIKLHASTQMSAHSLADVLFLEEMGFSRVVLSRELSLGEIKYINQNSTVQLETFVHGALCCCFSGQCLMSSFMGGRSGNRGKCAQPCRMKYSLSKNVDNIISGYLLSPKDIMAIDIMDKIIQAGATTLKIEGRMKSPEYVAITTGAYVGKLEKLKSGDCSEDAESKKKLTQIFNRGGFSQGYYENHSGKEMMSMDSPKNIGLYLGRVESYFPETGKCIISTEEPLTPGDGIEIWTQSQPHVGTGISRKQEKGERLVVFIKGDINTGDLVYKSLDKALMDEAKRSFEKDERKSLVSAFVRAKEGMELYLRLVHEDSQARAESSGKIVEQAKNQPMSREKIIAQLSKTGSTPFIFRFDNSEIDDNIFIPVAHLNELRRDAAEMLEDEVIMSSERRMPVINLSVYEKDSAPMDKQVTVLASTQEQMEAVLSSGGGVSIVYMECNGDETLENMKEYAIRCNERGIKLFAALPDIERGSSGIITQLEETGISGFLARNVGQLYRLRNTKKEVFSDYTFNVSNRLAYGFIRQYASNVALSPELSLTEINDIGGSDSEITIYGKHKLMTTAQCPIGVYAAEKGNQRYCKLRDKSNEYFLQDRMNVKMPVITNCNQCIAYIYNDRPTFMLSKTTDLLESMPRNLRLSFTNETAKETEEILYMAIKTLNKQDAHEAYRKINKFTAVEGAFTYGHFFKGTV